MSKNHPVRVAGVLKRRLTRGADRSVLRYKLKISFFKYVIIAAMKARFSETLNTKMSPRMNFLLSRVTILFIVSFIGLWLHILDDTFITSEPSWYGITAAEFLFYCALVYMFIPPFGLWLARRGSVVGLVIVLLYGFQAFYGAGTNHVRHLFGDFSGSHVLPTLLGFFGIHITDIRGYGFGTVLMGMAGLGITPPHTHILASTIVVFINIAVNLTLILFSALAIYTWWQGHRATTPAESTRGESTVTS